MKSFKIIIFLLILLSFEQVKSQTNTLVAYPNPFTDTLSIQVYLASNDTVTITVVSIPGVKYAEPNFVLSLMSY